NRCKIICYSILSECVFHCLCCIHVTNLFLLKAGKSTSWEDGGWGAWDEAELQEPYNITMNSVVKTFNCLLICIIIGVKHIFSWNYLSHLDKYFISWNSNF
uniref:Uncharacterized protein n=1 Tax=Buteo japonicus TaxID=224669 RepID=A0A8C0APA0_9AVES